MDTLDIILKLGLATLLGGLVGLERELHNQPAGLRTHIIVCLGSTLIMLVSIQMQKFSEIADPSRIAAQVITGIGFLGGGAILRFGTSVRGLTTAACLWTVAAIGLAIGAEMFLAASIVTILVLLSMYLFDKIEKLFLPAKTYRTLLATAKDMPGLIGKIEKIAEENGFALKNVGINKLLVEKKIQITALVKVPEVFEMEKISREISALEGVEQFEID